MPLLVALNRPLRTGPAVLHWRSYTGTTAILLNSYEFNCVVRS
jgi:hypothetical protein